MASIGYLNPIYSDVDDGSAASIENGDSFFNEHDEFLDEENLITDFENLNGCKKSISKWRDGPAPISSNGPQTEGLPKLGSICSGTKESDVVLSDDDEYSKTANQSILLYFQELSNEKAKFDFEFVDNLLEIADVNIVDIYGQSLLHEVAREWHVDVAKFLHSKGLNIDIADNYGRTPLFVAVASNYVEMTEWLLNHKANINHAAMNGQKPIHFAALNNAIDTMAILIDYGAHPDERDLQQQTPLFLAANIGSTKAVDYLLNLEVPTATYTTFGSTPTEQIIKNMPLETARKSLNQYIAVDPINSQLKFYLSSFAKKRWTYISHVKKIRQERIVYPTVLQTIVEKADLYLVTHEVVLKLLSVMMSQFGTKYLYGNLFLNMAFTIIWTIAATINKIRDKPVGYRFTTTVMLTSIGSILTVLLLAKLIMEYRMSKKDFKERRETHLESIVNRETSCHPRWPTEKIILDKEKEDVLRQGNQFWVDTWLLIDLFGLLATLVYIILTIIWLCDNELKSIASARGYYSVFFLIVVWLRLNRSLQFLTSLGQFISCLGHCLIATLRFGFLYMEFFIPFACGFWVFFGGKREGNIGEEHEYIEINNLLYQLYLLTIVGDYDYGSLKNIDEFASQILVGFYILLVSCVCLNLYIALLSEAFVRVHSFALATARLNQAKVLLTMQSMFPDLKRELELYLMKECSPLRTTIKSQSEIPSAIDTVQSLIPTLKEVSKEMQLQQVEAIKMKNNFQAMKNAVMELQDKQNKCVIHKFKDHIDDAIDLKSNFIFKAHQATVKQFERARTDLPFLFTEMKAFLQNKKDTLIERHSESNES